MNKIKPESDFGNIEYKYKLTSIDEIKIEDLVTQMKYRLEEGLGEAIYYIGVKDNGTIPGITLNEFDETFNNLTLVSNRCNSKISVISKTECNNLFSCKLLVREIIELNNYIDIKITVAGNVDSGKSTLIGVLIGNKLDNGKGLTRMNVFNHPHEIDTGRTSSISHQIMGFDINGNQVQNKVKLLTWDEIVKKSSKIVTFYDLAGHEKYLRTTIGGFSSIYPDYSFILIGSNMGITHMTKEHINLCIYFQIPFVIIMTKIDICPDHILNDNVQKIKKILSKTGTKKILYKIDNFDNIITVTQNIKSNTIVPIFFLSNVTGTGIDSLKSFINLLPPRCTYNNIDSHVEFIIDDHFQVTGCGTIVSGLLTSGTVKINDEIYIGPSLNNNNNFIKTYIKSIHYNKVPIDKISSGHYICLCLKKISRKDIYKGMVILSSNEHTKVYKKFRADVHILKSHHTSIRINYQPLLHINNIRQSAKIIEISDKNILRTGDRSSVIFEFICRPAYIKCGDKIIFREGKVRGMGIITKLL